MTSTPPRYMAALVLALAAISAGCQQDEAAPASAASSASPEVPSAVESAPVSLDMTPQNWDGNIAGAAPYELCALDVINGQVSQAGTFTIAIAEAIELEGWITSPQTTAIEDFSVYLTGLSSLQAAGKTGKAREDVAKALSNQSVLNSGFTVRLASGSVTPGEYAIALGNMNNGVLSICDTKQKLVIR